MTKKILICLCLVLLIGACNSETVPSSTVTPTSGLPTPMIDVAPAPDVEEGAQAYLEAWKAEDYEGMYALLSRLSQDAMTLEEFQKEHKDAAIALTMQNMDYAILSNMVKPSSAQVNYEISYTTTLLGTISRSTIMNLTLEENVWHVQWDASMILPELAGGNRLELTYEIPARGNIYDEFGYPLVAQDDAVAIGIVPGKIDPENEDGMVSFLADLLDVSEDSIREKYAYAQADWYVAIGDVSAAVAQQYSDRFERYPGIVLSPFRSRYYYDG
ncbi:MAG TPA: NTF2-like N-terminal transpeptidase domain-containing protein, partial [Anaerolineaceae bacterium]|nr:NTF2-like N-terminal transpeptidase domain-containing protein [Anaerolineaceae bacterium]